MKKKIFSFLVLCLFSATAFAENQVSNPSVEEQPRQISTAASTTTAHIIPKEWIIVLRECIQVYNEVKALYTEIIGEEQANATAQGAFVGCVGGLK